MSGSANQPQVAVVDNHMFLAGRGRGVTHVDMNRIPYDRSLNMNYDRDGFMRSAYYARRSMGRAYRQARRGYDGYRDSRNQQGYWSGRQRRAGCQMWGHRRRAYEYEQQGDEARDQAEQADERADDQQDRAQDQYNQERIHRNEQEEERSHQVYRRNQHRRRGRTERRRAKKQLHSEKSRAHEVAHKTERVEEKTSEIQKDTDEAAQKVDNANRSNRSSVRKLHRISQKLQRKKRKLRKVKRELRWEMSKRRPWRKRGCGRHSRRKRKFKAKVSLESEHHSPFGSRRVRLGSSRHSR